MFFYLVGKLGKAFLPQKDGFHLKTASFSNKNMINCVWSSPGALARPFLETRAFLFLFLDPRSQKNAETARRMHSSHINKCFERIWRTFVLPSKSKHKHESFQEEVIYTQIQSLRAKKWTLVCDYKQQGYLRDTSFSLQLAPHLPYSWFEGLSRKQEQSLLYSEHQQPQGQILKSKRWTSCSPKKSF